MPNLSAANYLPTDMNQLVDKVLSFFITQRGRSEDFKIEKRFFSSLPKTMIDPSSMEQAFLNIILNAQKAMPKGGTFTVSTVSLPQRKDDGKEVREVQIMFEDTGVGIPRENLPKIFNPFFSTRPDGTGLGLSITKNIVEQNGGKIEVRARSMSEQNLSLPSRPSINALSIEQRGIEQRLKKKCKEQNNE